MADRAQQLAEAHAIKLDSIKESATAELEAVYDSLRVRVSAAQVAGFFDAMNAATRQLIGKHGQRAVTEGNRYADQLMGGKANRATMAALGNTVEDYIAELEEHSRHVKALVTIRSRRMVRQRVGTDVITRVLLDDFDRGGEAFAFLKNSLKRALGAAVLQLGNEARLAAFRPRVQDADAS